MWSSHQSSSSTARSPEDFSPEAAELRFHTLTAMFFNRTSLGVTHQSTDKNLLKINPFPSTNPLPHLDGHIPRPHLNIGSVKVKVLPVEGALLAGTISHVLVHRPNGLTPGAVSGSGAARRGEGDLVLSICRLAIVGVVVVAGAIRPYEAPVSLDGVNRRGRLLLDGAKGARLTSGHAEEDALKVGADVLPKSRAFWIIFRGRKNHFRCQLSGQLDLGILLQEDILLASDLLQELLNLRVLPLLTTFADYSIIFRTRLIDPLPGGLVHPGGHLHAGLNSRHFRLKSNVLFGQPPRVALSPVGVRPPQISLPTCSVPLKLISSISGHVWVPHRSQPNAIREVVLLKEKVLEEGLLLGGVNGHQAGLVLVLAVIVVVVVLLADRFGLFKADQLVEDLDALLVEVAGPGNRLNAAQPVRFHTLTAMFRGRTSPAAV
ncbi:hypothetical protein TYRP_020213 [Tyrophagus putrescentiae]|nr:hypothetical protein TYRP_020213 [Tyrophagus putrescentiae]